MVFHLMAKPLSKLLLKYDKVLLFLEIDLKSFKCHR